MKFPITEGFFRVDHLMQASPSPINLEDDEELIALPEDLGNRQIRVSPGTFTHQTTKSYGSGRAVGKG